MNREGGAWEDCGWRDGCWGYLVMRVNLLVALGRDTLVRTHRPVLACKDGSLVKEACDSALKGRGGNDTVGNIGPAAPTLQATALRSLAVDPLQPHLLVLRRQPVRQVSCGSCQVTRFVDSGSGGPQHPCPCPPPCRWPICFSGSKGEGVFWLTAAGRWLLLFPLNRPSANRGSAARTDSTRNTIKRGRFDAPIPAKFLLAPLITPGANPTNRLAYPPSLPVLGCSPPLTPASQTFSSQQRTSKRPRMRRLVASSPRKHSHTTPLRASGERSTDSPKNRQNLSKKKKSEIRRDRMYTTFTCASGRKIFICRTAPSTTRARELA